MRKPLVTAMITMVQNGMPPLTKPACALGAKAKPEHAQMPASPPTAGEHGMARPVAHRHEAQEEGQRDHAGDAVAQRGDVEGLKLVVAPKRDTRLKPDQNTTTASAASRRTASEWEAGGVGSGSVRVGG